MSKKRRLTHAQRNKSLSEDLKLGGKYYDWVITTSFYSSIHFLENKLLPINIGGVTCDSIQKVKNAYQQKGRHIARLKLIQINAPVDIAIGYKWLDDKSRFSRYTTYKVTVTEADKALQYLGKIEMFSK
ncbi:MAG: hypothetical protein ACR2MS_04470 [Weeksellaceae bacterium]